MTRPAVYERGYVQMDKLNRETLSKLKNGELKNPAVVIGLTQEDVLNQEAGSIFVTDLDTTFLIPVTVLHYEPEERFIGGESFFLQVPYLMDVKSTEPRSRLKKSPKEQAYLLLQDLFQ